MERSNFSKRSVATLIVFTIILGIMATAFCVLYAVKRSAYSEKSTDLEKVYQRTFYDLVDNVNNAEIKLSKVLASKDNDYANRLLIEVNNNLDDAQTQLSYLPISMNGISETTKFINQLEGYTETLTKNKNGLSLEEKTKLKELYNAIYGIKVNLNKISSKISNGYVISNNLNHNGKDYNNFTENMRTVKQIDQEYPTMIYDGPFSESTMNKEIKGLNYETINKDEALKIVKEIFKDAKNVQFERETNGKFQTYDFIVQNKNLNLYVQLAKQGGKLLTISAGKDENKENITSEKAIEIAEEFVQKLGISNMKCVWTDKLENDIYLNLAPVINNVIIYPDLIKVKVDLATGQIIGYEATTYYTNHTERNLGEATISKQQAQNQIEDKYQIESIRLALSPIEYKGEILTYEFKCKFQGSIYYIYINAKTGAEENILKVVETTSGDLLMWVNSIHQKVF